MILRHVPARGEARGCVVAHVRAICPRGAPARGDDLDLVAVAAVPARGAVWRVERAARDALRALRGVVERGLGGVAAPRARGEAEVRVGVGEGGLVAARVEALAAGDGRVLGGVARGPAVGLVGGKVVRARAHAGGVVLAVEVALILADVA